MGLFFTLAEVMFVKFSGSIVLKDAISSPIRELRDDEDRVESPDSKSHL